MMKSNILFIGAGASFGARIELPQRPPLGNDLCQWLFALCPDLIAEATLIDLRSTVEDAQAVLARHRTETNYEALVARLERKDRVVLQRLIQISFSDLTEPRRKTKIDVGFTNQVDGYDQLISRLGIDGESWDVISLNYDILFEEALRRSGIEFYYPHFPFNFGDSQENAVGTKIFKPHGSINFFAHADFRIFHREPLPNDDRGLPTGHYIDDEGEYSPTYPIAFAGLAGAENVIGRAGEDLPQPAMANYTVGKKSDSNQETLNKIRQAALEAMKRAERMVVVGVRPIFDCGDDPFVSEALSVPVRDLTYISGSDVDCAAMLARHPHVKNHCQGLSEFLNSLT